MKSKIVEVTELVLGKRKNMKYNWRTVAMQDLKNEGQEYHQDRKTKEKPIQ